jgi:similar to stage IV sporulation protein
MANYMSGAVRIKITGKMPEKFINLCITQNINLWGIVMCRDEYFVSMSLGDFFQIRPLVRISKIKVEVVAFYGLPFMIKRVKARKMMVVGCLLFVFFLQYLTSFIWFVDITGNKTIPTAAVQELLYNNGLYPGVLKNDVNIKHIENQILVNVPKIAWVGISFTGTHAVVELVEKTLPQVEDKAPADIVAVKDGVITEIIALAGHCVVKKGDTVKKGDILIKGTSYDPAAEESSGLPENQAKAEPLRAKGIVKARVWYENYGEAPLKRTINERTGTKQIAFMLKIGPREFIIRKPQLEPDKQYQVEEVHKKLWWWRNSGFAVESITDTYYEIQAVVQEYTLEEAKEAARINALAQVQKEIPESAEIVGKHIEILNTKEPNLIRLKVNVETIEDIGRPVNTAD